MNFKNYASILFLFYFYLIPCQLKAQLVNEGTYDLQFTEPTVFGEDNQFCVTLQIQSAVVGESFVIGNYTLIIGYDATAIDNLSYTQINFGDANLCAINTADELFSPYFSPTFSTNGEEANLETQSFFPAAACPEVTNTWTDIGVFCFEIIDGMQSTGLSFNTTITEIYQNDNIHLHLQGTFHPLDISIPPCSLITTISGMNSCEGGSIILEATGGDTYEWTGPNGFISTDQNPIITSATSDHEGEYFVTIRAGMCAVIESVMVTVHPGVNGMISANTPVCLGDPIDLMASGGTEYVWTGPNGFTSAISNPVIPSAVLADTGTYMVTIMDDNGCVDLQTIDVEVIDLGNVTIINNTTTNPICEGEAVHFFVAEGVAWLWNGPNDFSSTEQNPMIPQAFSDNNGSYTVTVTDGNGCTGIGATLVNIFAPPTVTVSSNDPVCEGADLELTATGGDTYAWVGPNGPISSTDADLVIVDATLADAGDYFVTATDQNGCINSAFISVIIKPTPAVMASSNSPVAEGSAIQLIASGGATYIWSGPDGFSATTPNPEIPNTVIETNEGNYFVTVTDDNGCTGVASTSVSIFAGPSVAIVSNSPVCQGDLIELTAIAAGAESYVWSGPNGFSSTIPNPMISEAIIGTNNGDYSVTVTDANGFTGIGTISVIIHALPIAVASSNSPVCEGGDIELMATGGVSYEWTGPNSFISLVQNPVVSEATGIDNGDYLVTVTDANGCTSMDMITVSIAPMPEATISIPSSVCEGSTAQLNASTSTSGTNIIYAWSGPNGFTSTEQNPIIDPINLNHAGIYEVVVIVDGCVSEAVTATLNVTPLLEGPIVDCASITPTSVAFEWTSLPGATSYQLEILVNGMPFVGNPFMISNLSYTHFGVSVGDAVIINVTALGVSPCGVSQPGGQVCIASVSCDFEELLDIGEGKASGIVAADLVSNNDLDIFVTNSDDSNLLFSNMGGTIAPILSGDIITENNDSWGVAAGDYNNDNLIDLFVANEGANYLYHNNGGSGFLQNNIFPAEEDKSQGVTFVDYDNDGDLDISIANDGLSDLYRNDGGVFISTNTLSFTGTANSTNIVWGDYNNDGKKDFFITKIGVSNRLYKNSGDGNFMDIESPLSTDFSSSQGAAWGDMDNDGDLDLVVTNIDDDKPNFLYRNDGEDVFVKITDSPISTDLLTAQSHEPIWGDYNNDGWLDLYIVNSDGQNNFLYKNLGSGIFEKITDQDVVLDGVSGNGAAWIDFDNDNDLDVAVANSEGVMNKLYRNHTCTINTKPTPPSELSQEVMGNTVVLSWNFGSDTQQSLYPASLTYNIYLGTEGDKTSVVSPMADLSTGRRKVVSMGEQNHNTTWTIANLPLGDYVWSVQSIDHSFVGSMFAEEQAFTICPEFDVVPTVGNTEICSGDPLNLMDGSVEGGGTVAWVYGDAESFDIQEAYVNGAIVEDGTFIYAGCAPKTYYLAAIITDPPNCTRISTAVVPVTVYPAMTNDFISLFVAISTENSCITNIEINESCGTSLLVDPPMPQMAEAGEMGQHTYTITYNGGMDCGDFTSHEVTIPYNCENSGTGCSVLDDMQDISPSHICSGDVPMLIDGEVEDNNFMGGVVTWVYNTDNMVFSAYSGSATLYEPGTPLIAEEGCMPTSYFFKARLDNVGECTDVSPVFEVLVYPDLDASLTSSDCMVTLEGIDIGCPVSISWEALYDGETTSVPGLGKEFTPTYGQSGTVTFTIANTMAPNECMAQEFSTNFVSSCEAFTDVLEVVEGTSVCSELPFSASVATFNTDDCYAFVYVLTDSDFMIIASNTDGHFSSEPIGTYTLWGINYLNNGIDTSLFSNLNTFFDTAICHDAVNVDIDIQSCSGVLELDYDQDCSPVAATGNYTVNISVIGSSPPYTVQETISGFNETDLTAADFPIILSIPNGEGFILDIKDSTGEHIIEDNSSIPPCPVDCPAYAGNPTFSNEFVCFNENLAIGVTDFVLGDPVEGHVILGISEDNNVTMPEVDANFLLKSPNDEVLINDGVQLPVNMPLYLYSFIGENPLFNVNPECTDISEAVGPIVFLEEIAINEGNPIVYNCVGGGQATITVSAVGGLPIYDESSAFMVSVLGIGGVPSVLNDGEEVVLTVTDGIPWSITFMDEAGCSATIGGTFLENIHCTAPCPDFENLGIGGPFLNEASTICFGTAIEFSSMNGGVPSSIEQLSLLTNVASPLIIDTTTTNIFHDLASGEYQLWDIYFPEDIVPVISIGDDINDYITDMTSCFALEAGAGFVVLSAINIDTTVLCFDQNSYTVLVSVTGGLPEWEGEGSYMIPDWLSDYATGESVITWDSDLNAAEANIIRSTGAAFSNTLTPPNIEITDAAGCTNNIFGPSEAPICPECTVFPGMMNPTTLVACADDDVASCASGTMLGLGGNDVLAYVVHDSPSNVLGDILALSFTCTFSFDDLNIGAAYNTTYYISAIAGPNSGGFPDLADDCTQLSMGTPVIFSAITEVAANLIDGINTICPDDGECAYLTFDITGGVGPYELTLSDGTDEVVYTDIISSVSQIELCPLDTTVYEVVTITDSNGCFCPGICSTNAITVNTYCPPFDVPDLTANLLIGGNDTTICLDMSSLGTSSFSIIELAPILNSPLGTVDGFFDNDPCLNYYPSNVSLDEAVSDTIVYKITSEGICDTATMIVNIGFPLPPLVVVDTTIILNGDSYQVTLNISGGSGNYLVDDLSIVDSVFMDTLSCSIAYNYIVSDTIAGMSIMISGISPITLHPIAISDTIEVHAEETILFDVCLNDTLNHGEVVGFQGFPTNTGVITWTSTSGCIFQYTAPSSTGVELWSYTLQNCLGSDPASLVFSILPPCTTTITPMDTTIVSVCLTDCVVANSIVGTGISDILVYALHTNLPFDVIDTLSTSVDGEFCLANIDDLMVDSTYYISVIAGIDEDGDGFPDLNDACTKQALTTIVSVTEGAASCCATGAMATNAGIMPTDTLYTCDGAMAITMTMDSVLAPDDILSYILHDSPTSTIDTVLTHKQLANFTLEDITATGGMTNTLYYISPVAGKDMDGDLLADLASPCTHIGEGQPVVFLEPMVIDTVTTCAIGDYSLEVAITGGLPAYNGMANYIVFNGTNTTTITEVDEFRLVGGFGSELVYTIQVTDGAGCIDSISGSRACCTAGAGILPSDTTLYVCAETCIEVSATGTEGVAPSDPNKLAYYLHEGANADLEGILDSNITGEFCHENIAMENYDIVYYISSVAGPDNNGDGFPDLTDTCTNVAIGQPIIFLESDACCTADAGTMAVDTLYICSSECIMDNLTPTDTLLNEGEVLAFYIHTSSTDTVGMIANGSLSSNFCNNGTFDYNTIYYLSSVVGLDLDSDGFPDLEAPCTHVAIGQPVIFLEPIVIDTLTTCLIGEYTLAIAATGGLPSYLETGNYTAVSGINEISLTDTAMFYALDTLESGEVYTVVVMDEMGCSSTVTDSTTCCTADVGEMPTSNFYICELGATLSSLEPSSIVLEAEDVLAYYLHNSSADTLGIVVNSNGVNSEFFHADIIDYGTFNYISAVVGPDMNLDGFPDLTDPCTVVAPGTPVVFVEPIVPNFSFNGLNCANTEINFLEVTTGAGIAAMSSWDFDTDGIVDTIVLTNAPVTHTYLNEGTYTVTLTVTNAAPDACEKTISMPIVIDEFPVVEIIEIIPGNIVCLDSLVTLTATGAEEYIWYQNGDSIGTGNTIDATVQTDNTTFTVVGNNGECEMSAETLVTLYPAPTIDFEADITEACGETLITLTNLSQDISPPYIWVLANGTPPNMVFPNQENISISLPPGTYTVTFVASGECDNMLMPEIKTDYITIHPNPLAPEIDVDDLLLCESFDDVDYCVVACEGETIRLDAFNPILVPSVFSWWDIDGNLLEDGYDEPSYFVDTSGTYFVQQEINGCISPQTSIQVNFIAPPEPPVLTDASLCFASPIVFPLMDLVLSDDLTGSWSGDFVIDDMLIIDTPTAEEYWATYTLVNYPCDTIAASAMITINDELSITNETLTCNEHDYVIDFEIEGGDATSYCVLDRQNDETYCINAASTPGVNFMSPTFFFESVPINASEHPTYEFILYDQFSANEENCQIIISGSYNDECINCGIGVNYNHIFTIDEPPYISTPPYDSILVDRHSGPDGSYNYTVTPSIGLPIVFEDPDYLTGLECGEYEIIAEHVASGCTWTDTYYLPGATEFNSNYELEGNIDSGGNIEITLTLPDADIVNYEYEWMNYLGYGPTVTIPYDMLGTDIFVDVWDDSGCFYRFYITCELIEGLDCEVTNKKPQQEVKPDIVVYPNPSQGVFNYHISLFPYQKASLTIYNMLQPIMQQSVIVNTPQQIDLRDYPEGIYLLEFNFGTMKIVKKIIINN